MDLSIIIFIAFIAAAAALDTASLATQWTTILPTPVTLVTIQGHATSATPSSPSPVPSHDTNGPVPVGPVGFADCTGDKCFGFEFYSEAQWRGERATWYHANPPSRCVNLVNETAPDYMIGVRGIRSIHDGYWDGMRCRLYKEWDCNEDSVKNWIEWKGLVWWPDFDAVSADFVDKIRSYRCKDIMDKAASF